MKVIHKFRLANDVAETTLSLKQGYKIVHSEYVLVDKSIYIWVEQPLDVNVLETDVEFKVVKSGEPLPKHLQHVASVVDSFAPEAYHIFEQPQQVAVKPAPIDLSQLTFTAA